MDIGEIGCLLGKFVVIEVHVTGEWIWKYTKKLTVGVLYFFLEASYSYEDVDNN